eukprot:6596490-Alexandrium_andersonii.AAC.1
MPCRRKSHVRYLESGRTTQCSKTLTFVTDEERLTAIKRLKCWAGMCYVPLQQLGGTLLLALAEPAGLA